MTLLFIQHIYLCFPLSLPLPPPQSASACCTIDYSSYLRNQVHPVYRAEHVKPREVEAGASEKVAMKEEKHWGGRFCCRLLWVETQAPHLLIICNGEASYTMLGILYSIKGGGGHWNAWLYRKKFVLRSIVCHLVTHCSVELCYMHARHCQFLINFSEEDVSRPFLVDVSPV